MFGPEPLTEENAQLLGIVPRSCAHLITSMQADPTVTSFEINVAFFEIYMHNQIRDLLHPAKKGDRPLRVQDGKKGVFIDGLRSEPARNLTEILQLIAVAQSYRTVSSTRMNVASSRSHVVMEVRVTITRKDGSKTRSKLTFGDLAGSEKVGRTNISSQTLKEAGAVNQSLTMLGNVIAKLGQVGSGKKVVVPFRDSVLTHILKDSLAGNCKTTIVLAVSPHKSNIVETVNSFRFGSRCKLIKTKAEANKEYTKKQMIEMIRDLEAKNKALELENKMGVMFFLFFLLFLVNCVSRSVHIVNFVIDFFAVFLPIDVDAT